MDIAEMIEEFQSRGVALWANGDRLGYRSPKGVLTREDLAALKARKEEVLAHLRERDAIGHDEQARFEPFPMTDIQRAYATGQYSGYELGGTGCHSYAELLAPPLDRERLEAAWHELIRRHDMLSAVVIPPDSLRVVPFEEGPVLEEIDLATIRAPPMRTTCGTAASWRIAGTRWAPGRCTNSGCCSSMRAAFCSSPWT